MTTRPIPVRVVGDLSVFYAAIESARHARLIYARRARSRAIADATVARLARGIGWK